MPHAVAAYGVIGRLPDEVFEALDLADEYREKLCALYQERHERTVEREEVAAALGVSTAELLRWERATDLEAEEESRAEYGDY